MNVRLILPCAGYGTRMNTPINKSKELLLKDGRPLIQYSLDLAIACRLDPLVVTRAEKTDLIEYCRLWNIETQIIEVEGEWANTVLKSAPNWAENNILVLPDTVFSPPITTTQQISAGLWLGNNAVFALHEVQDPHKWGIVADYKLYEKPVLGHPAYAWGLIGFKAEYGKKLFANSGKGSVFPLENCGFTYLDYFQDLTRTGTII